MAEEHMLVRLLRRVRISGITLGKLAIAAVITLLIALLFPRGERVNFEYKVGAVWAQQDLIAPFSFPVFRDPQEYDRDVAEARKKVYDVFERDSLATDRQLEQLDRFFHQLSAAVTARVEDRRAASEGESFPDSVSAFPRLAA